MTKITGFLDYQRSDVSYEPASERIRHYREFTQLPEPPMLQQQAARCMDCGIPYCHTGCPVHNQIPDWNDLVYLNKWEEAARNLHSTNNFPEFTGRVCPAPCEEACTLNLENSPVTIKNIEQAIADTAWKNGWIKPQKHSFQTDKRIAIVGSGPAGLTAAQQLARAGHTVHVFEKHKKAGGLLRYGIPDFKMEKNLLDRRIQQLENEGVVFHYNYHIGVTMSLKKLMGGYDAILLAGGAESPRNLPLPGHHLQGVHYAMPYLTQQNQRIGGEDFSDPVEIVAGGKHVVVIGGGDTASDCIGTAFRQGAIQVTQLDIRPQPPALENKSLIWPYWPTKMRTSSSQAEGAVREFATATLELVGKKGVVTHIKCARVDEQRIPLPGSEFLIKADLVLIGIGFDKPFTDNLTQDLPLSLDKRGHILADDTSYSSSQPKIFVAGDMRRGQSLVVWAIREGRQAARSIDLFLMGRSDLPT